MGSDDWLAVCLGDVARIEHGWPFQSTYFTGHSPGQPIVVSIGNFQYSGGFRFNDTPTKGYVGPYPREFELSSRDILLVMTCQTPGGEILGIPARVPNDGRLYLHNQRMGKVVITHPDLVTGDFLYWLFLWNEFNQELVASATGTKILHTAPSRIEAFRFRLPSIQEQESIASTLQALDDKIELNRQMNRTLEAMAQAIFTSWFVDFDPVTTKAAGRQPAGMIAQEANLFPSRFVESSVGLIPAGWRVSTIGAEASIVGGSTPSTNESRFWTGGTINWITPRDLATLTDPVVLSTERRITPEGLAQISSGLLASGTVLLSSRAPIGYLAIAEIPLAINQGFIAIVCDKTLPNYYVRLWTQANLDEILARAGGTTFPEISKASFRPIPVVVPDRNVLQAFIRRVEPLHQRMVGNVRESSTLASLRDRLLPKLLSGEIRVRDAEKGIERTIA